jgi:hypothetical protein
VANPRSAADCNKGMQREQTPVAGRVTIHTYSKFEARTPHRATRVLHTHKNRRTTRVPHALFLASGVKRGRGKPLIVRAPVRSARLPDGIAEEEG